MKYRIKEYQDIRQAVAQMSVPELLRCVICPNISKDSSIPENTASVFVHPMTTEDAMAAAKKINDNRKDRALIVSDMEFGAAGAIRSAVEFPSMRAVKEAGDSRLAYEMGVTAAKEAMLAGYHWTFGPCVDITGNPMNPIVTYRTAGSNADDVIEYCGAYMRGLQDTGLIATLKHFPGDGYSWDDQHVTLTDNPLSAEDWDATFGKVYSQLIDQGAMSIMPGHISLGCYDEKDENGFYPPATVSKNLLTGLLKEKLGFEGIIISDATEMGGFCGYMYFYHACAAFLEAGGDCLLFVHETPRFVEEMENCIREGRLSIHTLRSRAYRMLCFARDYFDRHPQAEISFDRDAAEALSKTISEKAVKVIRDRSKLLPMAIPSRPVAHVILYNTWCADLSPAEDLTALLRSKGISVEEFPDPGPQKLLEITDSGEYGLILCSVLEAPAWAVNTARLSGPVARNMMRGWMKYPVPAVFVTYQSDCFAHTYRAAADTVISTYGSTGYTAAAVAKTIFGE